jgi:hypothetical protein
MVFLRGNLDEKDEAENVGGSLDAKLQHPFAISRDARELAHHYILTPIGKPENATTTNQQEDTKEPEPTIGTPLIVMPPGPVIIDPHEHDEDSDKDEEEDPPERDKAKIYDDYDSGEEKVAAMIEEMQKRAFDGGDPPDEENKNIESEEGLENDIEEDSSQGTEEDTGGEKNGVGEEDGGEEDGDGEKDEKHSVTDNEAIEILPESENEATGDQDQEEGSPVPSEEDKNDLSDAQDEVDPAGNEVDGDETTAIIGEDTQEGEWEPIEEDDGGLPTETPLNTELPGSDKNSDGDKAKAIDADGGEVDIGEDSETVNDEDVPSETPSDANDNEAQDTETENGRDSDGEGDGQEDGEIDNTEEKGSDQETPETKNNEDSDGNGQEQSEDAPSDAPSSANGETQETAKDEDASEALETMAPTAKQVTESSPAPTAMATEAKVIVTLSPTKAPVDEDLSPAPSRTPPDINNNDHDDASEAKSREKQPHTTTPIGTDGGPTFGALCRHPNGLIQEVNCKVILGFQSHPLAFSGAFLLLFIWGCCFCKRACKGRREADHGEYRAVAAQYDDVLFSDTFDDNYSASFADDRSADGSIESDEGDDWTKGPNIEMGAISNKEDDLTLEEMNG